MPEQTIEVARRFCGPPGSANGGYVAGRLARFIDAPAVGVRLRLPPPLAAPMAVRISGERAALLDGETKVAEARPVELDLRPLEAPSFEDAKRAANGFRGFESHVFPGCFVCGTERGEADGLRIFPGATGDAGLFAAPWIPDASLAPKWDRVPSEFIWAALDCPGAFSFPQPEGKILLLGEMQVSLPGSVRIGERCVVTSWKVDTDGRRHYTGSALHGESGECCGVALGIWFEVDPDTVPHG